MKTSASRNRFFEWLPVSPIAAVFLLCAPVFALGVESDDPAAELASFTVADGFEVQLFASEKDGVVKPIQMRFDARGRLWVVGSTAYPQIEPGQVPDDKVLILEDTKGTDHCDKVTEFANGLMIPTGIELGNGGAYVGTGTELLFLRDTDGDGKADERRVLLRGFGTGDAHQNINSFHWGPGGELWMSQGLHTMSNVETPWGLVRLHEAGLWRLRPNLMKLDGFFGWAFHPQNPWGFIFTKWGEPIVLAGSSSHVIYAAPALVQNRRELQPVVIWKEGKGRKQSNGDIVGTSHFPDDWQGTLLVGGYINNAVWSLKIADDGAGFSLQDREPLIKSSSRSFRPVDVKFGPDGALYICDWYNPIIGHYQASFRHPDRDKAHGRIWRVTAKGRPLTKPPQLADAPVMELLDALKSSDNWTRYFAKRVLADRPTDEVVKALKKWTARLGVPEHALVEALGVYQSHEIIADELLAGLCRASDPGARAYAAGVVGEWADKLPDPLALLRPLVADENPRVRLRAVVACTNVPRPEAMEVVAIAADFPTDPFLDYALSQAVFALKPHWLEAFKAGKLNLENKPARVALLVRNDGTADTLQVVREQLRSANLDPVMRKTFLRILADIGDADDLATILKLDDAPLQAELLPALAISARVRNVRPSGDLAAALRPLVENQNAGLRAEALKLAGVLKLEALRLAVEAAALDAKVADKIRRAAVESLASFGGDESRKTLTRLAGENAPSVQGAVIAALSGFDLPSAVTLAAENFSRITDDAALNEIFTAFLQRKGGGAALASALAKNAPPKPAAEAGLRLMNAGGYRDEKLARLLADAAGFSSEGKKMTPKETAEFANEVRASGDAKNGAAIFHRAELGCIVCHTVDGQGGTIGPDLSALGTAQPVDFIIGAILDPQKDVKEGFISISVTMKDGGEFQGYQLRETRDELVMRDVLQNKEIRLRLDEIRTRRENGSVMPAGLADTLTRAEFRDLVRYLSELGKPK